MIHSSAIIEEGAVIAEDAVIGPFCIIGKDVVISSDVKLEANVVISGRVSIAEGVRIFSFTTIGHADAEIEIGKATQIREFAEIGTQQYQNTEEGRQDRSEKIVIGEHNFIMGYVQIFSGVTLGGYCIITNAVKLYENVHCNERVIIGGLSTVEANNTIGSGVMIGGASYVTHDLPPFTLVEGNKATIKGLNNVGLRRRLKESDLIDEIRVIFKKVLGSSVDKALAEEISQTHENEYIKAFTAFIAKSNM